MRPYLHHSIAAGAALCVTAASLVATSLVAVGAPATEPARATASTTSPSAPAPAELSSAASVNGERGPHSFYFTRGIYTSYGRRGWGGARWATDYPKADQQFLVVLRRLTNLDAYDSEHAVALTDPELRRYPFVYMLEVGDMMLTPAEVEGLRGYMLAGGFVFIDDFWGVRDWQVFEEQMRRVLPEHRIVDLPRDHPVLTSFYDIDEILQIPSIGTVRRGGGQTTECYGCEATVRAIFDADGHLMMLINWNTDLGDAWEWAEQPDYPTTYSTFAYQMGVNAIVYAMSH